MDDIHIRILKFVLDKGEPTSIRDISDGLKIPEENLQWLNDEANTGTQVFIRHEKNEVGNWKFSLSMIGRQILLDYERLNDSRSFSRKSLIIAIVALLVAISSIALNIYELNLICDK